MSTQFLEFQSGKIAYDDTGEGPLVVCVPGLGDLRGQFRMLAPQLVLAGYRVVTMDVRGHGESSTEWEDYSVSGVGSDILALVRKLAAGPAILIGNSMGGGAVVWAAAEAPELVAGLVLIDPAVHGETNKLVRLFLTLLFARPWGPAFWLRYYAGLFPSAKPVDFPEYKAKLLANLKEPGRIESTLKMTYASQAASAQRLSRVSAPGLLIMGTKDPDFKDPEAEARWVSERIHAPYQMVEGAGHYPHVEMPEVTRALTFDFLENLKEKRELVYAT